MAKRLIYIGIVLLASAGIIWLLLQNRDTLQAEKLASVERPTAVAVKTATATIETVKRPVSLIGTVRAYQDVVLVAEVAGQIRQIMAKPGDYMPAGGPLLKIEDDLPRANFAVADANLKKARKDLERFQALKAQNATTDAQLDNAVLAVEQAEANHVLMKQQLDRTTVRVPFGGVIAARMVDVGAYLAPGTPIANLVDLSQVKVVVNVPEEDVFKLRRGDPVVVTTSLYPGRRFAGRIFTISDKADEAHTYAVEVLMANPNRTFKAGMFARVEFTSISAFNALVIPREALTTSLKNPRVYVVADGRALSRDIVVGQELDKQLAVISGLKAGDIVVIGGQINLTEGAPVAIVK